ncbi:MAG: hypothetical protein RL477_1249 [Pseudomonadota bacterium]|jgi:cytochrome c2
MNLRPFIALMAVMALWPAPTRAQETGEADFNARCARCHSAQKAAEFLKAHPDAGERAQWLERKLARHHARDKAERARIIAFLERIHGGQK